MTSSPEARGTLLTLPELDGTAHAALARAGLNGWAVRGHSDFTPIVATERQVNTPTDEFDITTVAID